MIFKDKTVIVTGASEGVGAAAARKFADAGANLVLVARSKKNLEIVADELRDKARVEIFAMDVADADACVDLFKKAEFEFGRVDVLINNAGCHARGAVGDVPAEDLGRMIDVNLKAPIMLTRLALPYLQKSDGAAIINVASIAGRTPVPGSATYSASKFGLRIFTFALAEELRGTNIKVAAISPGPINTGFIMTDIDSTPAMTFSQPMSTAEEVAQAILAAVVTCRCWATLCRGYTGYCARRSSARASVPRKHSRQSRKSSRLKVSYASCGSVPRLEFTAFQLTRPGSGSRNRRQARAHRPRCAHHRKDAAHPPCPS